MIPDDLTAVLDEIRANANGDVVDSDEDCADPRTSCLGHNALRAVAALEAGLKVADEYDVPPYFLDDVTAARRGVALRFREAITREIAERTE